MRRGTFWGREVEMQGSPLTYLYYKREFGGDLGTDLVAVYSKGASDVETMLRFCWAMCKTHDTSTSTYEEWLSEFDPDEFSALEPPVEVIDSAICAELFRVRQAKRSERIRRWFARLLGRLSEFIGSQASRLLAR